MNLRSLAARRDPDCTDRRRPNLADHRISVASLRRWVQPLRIELDLCPFSKMRPWSRMSRPAHYPWLCCSAEEVLRR